MTGAATDGKLARAAGAEAGDSPSAAAGGPKDSDADEAAAAHTEPAPVKPRKKTSKPFVPTDKIDAESVVSFPADI